MPRHPTGSRPAAAFTRTVPAFLLACSAIVSACGGDGGDGPPTPPPVAATATAAQPTSAPPPATQPPDATPTPAATEPSGGALAAQASRDALAAWLGPVGDPASIEVLSLEPVTWRDGCLELPRPGRACTTALTEGFRVTLGLANARYEVRTDASAGLLLWAPRVQVLARFAQAETNLFSFTTDDGGALTAQPVPGTDYGVEPSLLSPGDPVGLALVDAPQSGGLLLVWLDSVP